MLPFLRSVSLKKALECGLQPPENAFRIVRCPENEAYFTVSVRGTEWARLPLIPVIVRLYVPERAGLFTRMVMSEEPERDTVDGLQEAEVRGGKPLRLSKTVPVKPCSAATETVADPLSPRAI
jgi:hypothetical protein